MQWWQSGLAVTGAVQSSQPDMCQTDVSGLPLHTPGILPSHSLTTRAAFLKSAMIPPLLPVATIFINQLAYIRAVLVFRWLGLSLRLRRFVLCRCVRSATRISGVALRLLACRAAAGTRSSCGIVRWQLVIHRPGFNLTQEDIHLSGIKIGGMA